MACVTTHTYRTLVYFYHKSQNQQNTLVLFSYTCSSPYLSSSPASKIGQEILILQQMEQILIKKYNNRTITLPGKIIVMRFLMLSKNASDELE